VDIRLRDASSEDAEACGKICYEAFKTLADRHGFPPDLPAASDAIGILSGLLSHPEFYGVVAEANGRIIGSNFLDERASVVGLGPITVDPEVQNSQVGRMLMEHALERARSQGRPSVRLVQAAYHNRSLCLYSKLGFEVREPLACLQGEALNRAIPDYEVRPATAKDLDACNALCRSIHGYDRSRELSDAIAAGTASVVEHDGRISGYATMVGFMGHAVGRTNTDLKALIGASPGFIGPGFLLPTRNGDLFRWCLDSGLRAVQMMTYMSTGLYNEPQGAHLPSILL
jgi:GNAT superfamily N-acetyltransferase